MTAPLTTTRGSRPTGPVTTACVSEPVDGRRRVAEICVLERGDDPLVEVVLAVVSDPSCRITAGRGTPAPRTRPTGHPA